ncbi:site-specific integrase [uncultured Bacteroides sp.]|uniref:site-specific integrase n=1 Tax=uncultured Bacteroides sp. TaxID=162156 RepID=UPI002593A1C1|nr:site-specific integrase [uncultured Bacteroides sp.]
MATVKFYLDKRREKKDGTYPIKLNVFHNRQMIISTQFSAAENEWDGNEFSKGSQNYKPRNIAVRSLMNKAETVIFNLEQEGKLNSTTDSALKTMIECAISTKVDKDNKNFIYYLDEFVSKKSNIGTRTVYSTTRNKILEYDPKCTFDSMDKKWLTNFEAWMAQTMKVNAYAIHLRNIRAVFNYAIDEEYTTLYPFRKFSIKKEETRKRCLTVEQLRTLRDYPCEEYQVKYRDMFMLMFYLIGVNASDLFLAKKTDVVNGRLEYKRHKTSRLYSIRIEPEAMEIINKYAGMDEYLLDIMDSYGNYKDFLHRMGIALKQIGDTERKGLGGKKNRKPLFSNISSYWSRHTWATLAAELDIPVETISRAMGHSIGSDVTSIYIKFDEKKIDAANRMVIDYLNRSDSDLL